MATKLQFYAILLIAAAASSFTIINAEESHKSEEHADQENSVSEVTTTKEDDSKEKRSQEEIMFGNQQNKPNGLVDDLMAMSEDDGEANDKSNDSQGAHSFNIAGIVLPLDEPAKEDSQNQDASQNANMIDANQDPWFKVMPASSNAVQYRAPYGYGGGLYDQEDQYRRKRQLLGGPRQRRRRSLRSSLGQMIQKRGIRMPRRSMRLKRNVDMGDLLGLMGNDRYYVNDEQVPGQFSGYPETPAPEYRYPYVFQHRGEGILSPDNEMEDSSDSLEGDNMEDVDNLMLLPPNSRYADVGLPYGSRDELQEDIQKWLNRHTVPSPAYRVQRRSAPYFYPIDYRYMPLPGYKKRSAFRGNHPSTRFSGGDDADVDSGEFGKWGHVVQVPESYASPEDIARLYGLANLLAAEGEDPEPTRVKRVA